jgi:hypothetical protein
MADNKIYPFAQPATPPNILSNEDYAASTTVTSTGYVAESIASSALMSKAQRQTSAIAAGIAQWIADNQVAEVNDSLSPATLAGMITAGLSAVNLTTQPQFDYSQKAATTEFVKRAAGSFESMVNYGVNTALTNADVGRLVVPSTAGLVFSLPLTSGVPAGSKIEFNGNGHGCAIARTGADVIRNGTDGNLSTISLAEEDSVVLVARAGQWDVIAGEGHQKVSTAFENSLITNGYQKLPSGLIEQWGVGFLPGTGNTASDVIITFPEPFPNACLMAIANSDITTSTRPAAAISVSAPSADRTVSQFKCYGYTSGVFSNASPLTWFAIGH